MVLLGSVEKMLFAPTQLELLLVSVRKDSVEVPSFAAKVIDYIFHTLKSNLNKNLVLNSSTLILIH